MVELLYQLGGLERGGVRQRGGVSDSDSKDGYEVKDVDQRTFNE